MSICGPQFTSETKRSSGRAGILPTIVSHTLVPHSAIFLWRLRSNAAFGTNCILLPTTTTKLKPPPPPPNNNNNKKNNKNKNTRELYSKTGNLDMKAVVHLTLWVISSRIQSCPAKHQAVALFIVTSRGERSREQCSGPGCTGPPDVQSTLPTNSDKRISAFITLRSACYLELGVAGILAYQRRRTQPPIQCQSTVLAHCQLFKLSPAVTWHHIILQFLPAQTKTPQHRENACRLVPLWVLFGDLNRWAKRLPCHYSIQFDTWRYREIRENTENTHCSESQTNRENQRKT